MQEKPITSEETARLAKLKAAKLETDEDLIALGQIFDEDAETEDHEPETEQSLEF